MSEYVLAVDGGGTKTHVVCADLSGAVVGEGMSGPASLTALSPGAASYNVREAVRQSLASLPEGTPIKSLVMGLAGMDTPEEEAVARPIFTDVLASFQIGHIQLLNDTIIALENGTEAADALVLISGTGSNCYGRNSAGQTAKAGGMDYLLTDQGSGYAIGRAVLRFAVKSFDGRIGKTALEPLVCEHFRIKTIAELKNKVTTPPLTKTEVAELTQVCLRAFDQGDERAKSIFKYVVNEFDGPGGTQAVTAG
jgi:N-acetylglucosamine kinase-like BadF-type ATPase